MLTKEEFDALPEVLKGNFEADGDTYKLKTEDTSGLKNALAAERKRAEAAEKLAKKFDGLDAEKARQVLAEAEKKAQEDEVAKGNFQQILDDLKAKHKTEITTFQQNLQAVKDDYAKKDVQTWAMKALADGKAIPERLKDALKLAAESLDFERNETGETVVKYKESNGVLVEIKPEEFVAKFKESRPYFFQSEGKDGGGDRNQQTFSNGVITLTDAVKNNPQAYQQAKEQAAKTGATIAFAE